MAIFSSEMEEIVEAKQWKDSLKNKFYDVIEHYDLNSLEGISYFLSDEMNSTRHEMPKSLDIPAPFIVSFVKDCRWLLCLLTVIRECDWSNDKVVISKVANYILKFKPALAKNHDQIKKIFLHSLRNSLIIFMHKLCLCLAG